jgi:hypothetical protein
MGLYTEERNDCWRRGPMSGRRSERMANITSTLPIPLLERIDELVHEGKAPSRSHVIREAVKNYLKTF